MDEWRPEGISAYVQCVNDFSARPEETGMFVDGQALELWLFLTALPTITE